MNASRTDFGAFKGHKLNKTWYINQTINGVTSPYNMTGKTIKLKFFDRVAPVRTELFVLDQTAVGNGFVTFDFSEAQASTVAIGDYELHETLMPAGTQIIGYGTITFIDQSRYIPFADIVRNEIPPGLVIPENFITIKSFEWRSYLQFSFEPNIADADLNNETAWPLLVNFLIAKLVVYDYIQKQLKGLVARNDATDEANSANVKKIETGPSNAEFFDSLASSADFFKTDKAGNNALTAMAQDICQLAKRLSIYLPICKNNDQGITIPLKTCRPENPTAIDILNKHFS